MQPTQYGIVDPNQLNGFEREVGKPHATNDAEKIFQEGYQQGQKDAISAEQAAEKQLAEKKVVLLEQQNELLSNIQSSLDAKSTYVKTAIKTESATLIQKLVLELTKAEVITNRDVLIPIIDDALNLFIGEDTITLYLNPESSKKISECFNNRNIKIAQDEKIALEDFYLEQGFSKINGKLEERVARALASVFDQQ